jgi:hypothetical protein
MARTAVVAGTATAVSGHVAQRQQARYAEQGGADAPQEAATGQEPTPATGLPADVIDQLKQLAALKDQGVLTEEEFAAQKAKILNA